MRWTRSYDCNLRDPLRGSEPLLTLVEAAQKFNVPELLDSSGKGKRGTHGTGFPQPVVKIGSKGCRAARYRLSELATWAKARKETLQ